MPENPSAWLMTTAKHRAIDVVRRERTARRFAPEMGQLLDSEWTLKPALEEAFELGAIRSAELRMMFSCCHHELAEQAQLALILNLLCGFGVSEIASALLVSRAAIEKRIARGKHVLAAARNLFELDDARFAARLTTVHHALYLLFSEGYHGASPDTPVQLDLCAEALRLTRLLREHAATATPASDALAALMCLHAARLPARLDAGGELSPLAEHDRSRWDARLVAEGLALLDDSRRGDEPSAYHLEAAIAATHASARTLADTDWATIVTLYDRLLELAPSPVVALSRAIALGRHVGPERGLEALHAIVDRARLARYPFYEAALGELELERGQRLVARQHFANALGLARNAAERRLLEKRLRATSDA
jgi:predicted RNA polymerase sigma factor